MLNWNYRITKIIYIWIRYLFHTGWNIFYTHRTNIYCFFFTTI